MTRSQVWDMLNQMDCRGNPGDGDRGERATIRSIEFPHFANPPQNYFFRVLSFALHHTLLTP